MGGKPVEWTINKVKEKIKYRVNPVTAAEGSGEIRSVNSVNISIILS